MPFASGVPTVRLSDAGAGGLHEGCSSGGPWTRFPEVQASYAGTRGERSGVAPAGRAYASFDTVTASSGLRVVVSDSREWKFTPSLTVW